MITPLKIALFLLVIVFFTNCSPARRLYRELRTNPTYTDHFTGVAVYDPVRQRALIEHNADKPFVPASTTKLFSFYAGLLTLPDSLPLLRYTLRRDSLIFWGVGNPLLLHPDLPDTTALAFLRNRPERLFFSPTNYAGPRFGPGWAWDDYNDDYSPELTVLPIYGNVVRFTQKQPSASTLNPHQFTDSVRIASVAKTGRAVRRGEFNNQFLRPAELKPGQQDVPFRWSPGLVVRLLADTLHRPVYIVHQPMPADARLLRGSSTDSLYKRMLQVSDNLFAEQLWFMISAEQGQRTLDPAMTRRLLADTLLRSLGPPGGSVAANWADGSGLSRYNLFTPSTLIRLLKKMADRVPLQRLFSLLPATGQSGTLRTMMESGKPYVFAKSGSMSAVYNLSGYLLTARNRLLYFSIMHNNFTQPVSEMRRRTAELLKQIHERL